MIEVPFIGRTEELKRLTRLLRKKTASLVVIKGRRRVGKSRLIEQFGECSNFLEFSGLLPKEETTPQSQRDVFAFTLSEYMGVEGIKSDDWMVLFSLLAKHTASGKFIILLDEISWMGSKDPDFLGKLKIAWDKYFKKNPQLILVLCGSASVWIEQNILSDTGFLGRDSLTIDLQALPLTDCNDFWEISASDISLVDRFKILSITGGIPRYLEEIDPQLPAEENIRELAFKKGGILATDFKKIFSDLFRDENEMYRNVVKTLADGPLEFKTICNNLNYSPSGQMTEYLDNLIKSGFISRDYAWNIQTHTTSKISQYRLADNYVRFYLKYIEKNLADINKGTYHLKSLGSLTGWSSIIALQFENLVVNNGFRVHELLQILPEDIVKSGPYLQRKTAKIAGCQIDYLIQTRFNTLFICEVRFSRNEIRPSIIEEMKNKIKRFSIPKGFSVCPVLIHVNGVSDSVIDTNYFVEIIDFCEFLR